MPKIWNLAEIQNFGILVCSTGGGEHFEKRTFFQFITESGNRWKTENARFCNEIFVFPPTLST
jgi:hypothetical protein